MGDAHVFMGVILLVQTVVGFVGDLSLLSHYLFLSCMGNSISQGDSKWAGLKGRPHKQIVSTVYFSWGVFILLSIVFLMFMKEPKAQDNMRSLKAYGYFPSMHQDPATNVLYVSMLSVPDVLCLGLMLCASTSMLFILYRHKQSMRHIQRISVSTRGSLKSRATIIILFLMSTFISFYIMSYISQNCLSVIYNNSPVLHHMAARALGCFPALRPFLLMSGHSIPCSLLFTCTKKKVFLP
ncbi:PREDICTED: vomeronasal type-1 receptor 4-like [Dipodomys ordii]|uniref:Vomeronasal type-1 receptor n=1 Tax=Dipodomys ordii TaxID=10020 RepID=A0A1S3G470_DIPOR|nr:PREDICTED: vomeronasal type-1 receptor 4-like [Dipodomys ordii]